MSQPICFIDFDQTMVALTSNSRFFLWQKFRRDIPTPTFNDIRKGLKAYNAGVDYSVTQALAHYLKGVSEDHAISLGQRFSKIVIKKIIPETMDVISDYARTHRLCIISASFDFIVKPVVTYISEKYGLQFELITNVPEFANGVCTGNIAEHVYSNAKFAIARKMAREAGLGLENCVFISDHISDALLLSAVGQPVIVRPDSYMSLVAARQGWHRIATKKEKFRADRLVKEVGRIREDGTIHIGVFGYLGLFNTGADYRLNIVLSHIQKAYRHQDYKIHLFLADTSRNYEKRIIFDDPKRLVIHECETLHLRRMILSRLHKCHRLMIVEGAPLYEKGSQLMFDFILDMALYGSLLKIPVLFYSCDCMVVEKPENLGKLKYILNRPNIQFLSRSLATTRYLESLGIDAGAPTGGADLVFEVVGDRPAPSPPVNTGGHLRIGIACTNMFHYPIELQLYRSKKESKEDIWHYPFFYTYHQSYLNPIAPEVSKRDHDRLIENLVDTLEAQPGAAVELLCFEPQDIHEATAINRYRELRGLAPYPVIDSYSVAPREMMARIGGLHVVMGGRFHAMVFGMVMSTPCVPFAMDERFKECAEYSGVVPVFNVDYRSSDFASQLAGVLKHLREKGQSKHQASSDTFDTFIAGKVKINTALLESFLLLAN